MNKRNKNSKNKGKARVLSLGTIFLLATAAGCGKAGSGTNNPGIEVIPVSLDGGAEGGTFNTADTDVKNTGTGNMDVSQSGDEGSDTQTDNNAQAAERPQIEDKLIGSVRSIGDNSAVISQAFEEDENILVAPGEGSPNEMLVTVYFSESTAYEVKTIKNGGVNGDADVESREGSFSDIKEKGSVDLFGCYDGADFYAERAIIYIFI